jgi:hypothetical protein
MNLLLCFDAKISILKYVEAHYPHPVYRVLKVKFQAFVTSALEFSDQSPSVAASPLPKGPLKHCTGVY